MPVNRFYSPVPFSNEQQVSIEGEEAHHLQKVLRKNVGDTVELVNGQNELAKATVIAIEKRSISLQIESFEASTPPETIILAIPYSRQQKLDLIIEKGCELGATEFWLFPSELGEKESLSPTQEKRLETLLIAAMKQCGRLDLPTLVHSPALLKWESLPNTTFFGDTREEAPWLKESIKQLIDPVTLITGPEGGLTNQEVAHLEHLGSKGVKLHSNILRMETAPLCGLVILTSMLPCKRSP